MTESSPFHAARVSRLTRLALAASIAVMGALAVTGTAHADTTRTLPGGTYCKFDVTETTLKDHTKVIENASGIRSTGNFVVQFAANGKSVTYNVSGATKYSTSSSNILTATYTGPSFIGIGPGGQSNTGQPGIVYSPGRTVVTVDLNTKPQPTVLTFSATAPVTNVCALLA